MDLVIVDESTFSIPLTASMFQACVMIIANDDQIVEGAESFYFILRASNPLDMPNQSTTIDVIDNDGKS